MHDGIIGLGGRHVERTDKEQLRPVAVHILLLDAEVFLLEVAPRCFL